MAKQRGARGAKPGKKTAKAGRGARRTPKAGRGKTAKPARKRTPARAAKATRGRAKARKTAAKSPQRAAPAKVPRLNRARRTLDDDIVQTPPSSLDMVRRGSAARTGRAEMAEHQRDHHGMNDMSAGDVDVNVEDAFFTGEEAPGGDNPTPDQDVVDDIGKALGVEYADNEELKAADKVTKRDKHRWELDPASSEDYKERD